MIDDNNASLPCCHLFIMGAGWSLFQQAVRKGRWPFAMHKPSFSLQIIHVLDCEGKRSTWRNPLKVSFLDTGTHHTWRAKHTSDLNLISKVWVQAHEAPCHCFSVWRAIGIQSRGPGCMSSSESGRIKPERRELHDLPNIMSTAPGSPRGELLMAALSASSISVSRCHIGEKFDPKVSDNHIPSFFSPRRIWDSGSWHPGTSDLSWFRYRHQSQLPHSMSGSRPKWFVM